MTIRKHERGASAIIVAASALLLIGMAAIAVDLGAGFNERRQDQTAADLAAMAIVVDMSNSQQAVTAGLAIADANLDHDLTAAQWQTAWENCVDADRPTGFDPMPAPAGYSVSTLDCVSLNPSFNGRAEVRVRLPDMSTDTAFGGAVGVDTLVTSAEGHGAFEIADGDILPFGLEYGVDDGTQCLTTSPGGNASPPCDGPTSGNFGALDIPIHGNPNHGTGTTTDCLPDLPELAHNAASGLDHFVFKTRPGMPGSGGPASGWSSAVDDGWAMKDACNTTSGFTLTDSLPTPSPINTLPTRTGFVFQGIQHGMIGDITDITKTYAGSLPRLQQLVDPGRWVGIREKQGPTNHEWRLDNTPIWFYLREPGDLNSDVAALGLNGPTCNRTQLMGDPWPDNRNNFELCLAAYQAYAGSLPVGTDPAPLFKDSIGDNPRFAWSPEFHYSPYPSGVKWMPIHDFRPVYLDGITLNCVNSGGPPTSDPETNCSAGPGQEFYPGQYANGGTPKASYTPSLRLDQISTFVLPKYSLPSEVLSTFPGGDGPFQVRLVR